MLVDAETLEPARDGYSRVFGEATERIKPELFESFVEIATPVGRDSRGGRGRAAGAAARGGRAGSRARARGARRPARIRRPARRVPLVPVERYRRMKAKLGPGSTGSSVCGLHVHVSRARRRHLPARLRGSRSSAARAARGIGELAVPGRERTAAGARSAPRSCSRCRPAARRRVLRDWDDWGRAARRQHAQRTGTRGRVRSTGRSRCASWTSRRRSPHGRARSRGAAARPGGGGAGRRAAGPRGVRGGATRAAREGARPGGGPPARARAGGGASGRSWRGR